MWRAFGFRLEGSALGAPQPLVVWQQHLYAVSDTISPLDPFMLPVELLWDRMPASLRAGEVGERVAAGLERILRGRTWFQAYWRPLRDFRMVLDESGSRVVAPDVQAAEREALCAAAVVAATTVVERCVDLGAHVAYALLSEAPRQIDSTRPVDSLVENRKVLRRLLLDPALVASGPSAPAAGFIAAVEEDPMRRGVRGLAVAAAAKTLAADNFQFVTEDGGLTSEATVKALRDILAHGRDITEAHLDQPEKTLSEFAQVMQAVFGHLQWLLLASTSGSACREWFDST
jgi:hypothetical protein